MAPSSPAVPAAAMDDRDENEDAWRVGGFRVAGVRSKVFAPPPGHPRRSAQGFLVSLERDPASAPPSPMRASGGSDVPLRQLFPGNAAMHRAAESESASRRASPTKTRGRSRDDEPDARSDSRRRRNRETTGGDARRSCAPPRPPPAAPPRRPNRHRRRRYPRRRRARPDARTASGSRRSSCRTGAGSPLTRSKPYRCGDRFARERCCERRWRGGLGRVSTRAARDERGRETRRRRGEKRREPGESLPSRACSDGKKTLDWPSARAGRTRRRGSTRCTARAAGASPTSSRRGGPL